MARGCFLLFPLAPLAHAEPKAEESHGSEPSDEGDLRPGKVVWGVAPSFEASFSDIRLSDGNPASDAGGSLSLVVGLIGAGISLTAGQTLSSGLYQGLAVSFSAYFNHDIGGGFYRPGVSIPSNGSGQTVTIGVEFGHLRRHGLFYKLGLGARFLEAESRVAEDSGNFWVQSRSAFFFGPMTYVSGGLRWPIGGGLVIGPQATAGLSLLFASGYSSGAGSGDLQHGAGCAAGCGNWGWTQHFLVAVQPTASLAIAGAWDSN